MRVLVVGAGIGGLSAAIALRRAGIDAVVFERGTDVDKIALGGGWTLWANGVRVLQRLGVFEAAEQAGDPIEALEAVDGRDGAQLASIPIGELGREVGAPSLGIMRSALHGILVGALGGDALQLGRECVGFEQDDTGVSVRFADGAEERGDVLVGADGLRSVIREQLNGPAPPRYPGYGHWFGIANDHEELAARGIVRIHWGRGNRFVCYPVGGGKLQWAALIPTPEKDDDSPEERKHRVAEAFRGWTRPVEELIDELPPDRIFRLNTVDRQPTKRWGEGRVTMLGDAAHATTVGMGQGAGMALEDGVVLARCLVGAPDPVAALREYESTRYDRTTKITKLSRRIGAAGAWKNPAAVAVRNLIIRRAAPGVKKGTAKDFAIEL